MINSHGVLWSPVYKEETETQRGSATCPRSHREEVSSKTWTQDGGPRDLCCSPSPRQPLTLPTLLTRRKQKLCLFFSESREIRIKAYIILHQTLIQMQKHPERPRKPRPTFLPLRYTYSCCFKTSCKCGEEMKQNKNSLKNNNLEQKTKD